MMNLLPELIILVLAVMIAYLIKTNKELRIRCSTDARTGVGNLDFFRETCDKIKKEGRGNEYFVAYIRMNLDSVQDGRSPEDTEKDILKAAEKIKGSCVKDDFAARAGEASFVTVYHCKDTNSARWRVTGLLGMINAETGGSRFRAGICPVASKSALQLLEEGRRACVTAEKEDKSVYVIEEQI